MLTWSLFRGVSARTGATSAMLVLVMWHQQPQIYQMWWMPTFGWRRQVNLMAAHKSCQMVPHALALTQIALPKTAWAAGQVSHVLQKQDSGLTTRWSNLLNLQSWREVRICSTERWWVCSILGENAPIARSAGFQWSRRLFLRLRLFLWAVSEKMRERHGEHQGMRKCACFTISSVYDRSWFDAVLRVTMEWKLRIQIACVWLQRWLVMLKGGIYSKITHPQQTTRPTSSCLIWEFPIVVLNFYFICLYGCFQNRGRYPKMDGL